MRSFIITVAVLGVLSFSGQARAEDPRVSRIITLLERMDQRMTLLEQRVNGQPYQPSYAPPMYQPAYMPSYVPQYQPLYYPTTPGNPYGLPPDLAPYLPPLPPSGGPYPAPLFVGMSGR